MHLDELRDYCLALPAVTEELPFGPDTLVFKVGDPSVTRGTKMFAAVGLEWVEPAVNLKCDPERAVELREQYDAVAPGYHMNKTHWNTVGLQGDVPAGVIRELVDHSYALVQASLPTRIRARIEAEDGGEAR